MSTARLVHRQTACKNQIRAILDRQAILWPEGSAGFTEEAMDRLEDLAEFLDATPTDELWRGILMTELTCLRHLQEQIKRIETKLDKLTATDPRAKRLQTIPGVGSRTAEAVLAILDDPGRFKNGKQVGAYIGLVPRQYQSGQTNRQGRISGAGNPTLRTLLIEVSWIGLRYNPWMREVYDRVRAGSNARKKVAIVAVARRLLIRCWAMLRDQTTWQPQKGALAGGQNLEAKAGYPCNGNMTDYVDILDHNNAWSTLDVLDIHYFPITAWDSLYNTITSRGLNLAIWQTEAGFVTTTAWVPNTYPRFFYWALCHIWQPDRYKIFRFAYWAPDDPNAYGYHTCFLTGSNLNYHGKALTALAQLVDGPTVQPYTAWSTHPALGTSLTSYGGRGLRLRGSDRAGDPPEEPALLRLDVEHD